MVFKLLNAGLKSAAKMNSKDLKWELQGNPNCKEVVKKLFGEGWDIWFVLEAAYSSWKTFDELGLERKVFEKYEGTDFIRDFPAQATLHLFENGLTGKSTLICDTTCRSYDYGPLYCLTLKIKIFGDHLLFDNNLKRFGSDAGYRKEVTEASHEALGKVRPYIYRCDKEASSQLAMYSKLIQYRDWNLEGNKLINLDISEATLLLNGFIKDDHDSVEVY